MLDLQNVKGIGIHYTQTECSAANPCSLFSEKLKSVIVKLFSNKQSE